MQKHILPATQAITFPPDLFSVPKYSKSHILTFQELSPLSWEETWTQNASKQVPGRG